MGGHVQYLCQLLQTVDVWKALWADLGLKVFEFEECGLHHSAADVVIWDYCQREQLVLVTANRNSAGPDSLGAMIATRNPPTCLPALTLANLARIEHDRSYAMEAAMMLLQRMSDIEQLRGIGRLFIP